MIAKYRWLWLIPSVFLLDQATKLWIITHLEKGEVMSVVPGLFDIVHVTNRGAAFGLLSSLPDPVRGVFFHITSALAVLALLIYFYKLESPSSGPYVSLALILGGATGNICDRILRGEVTDFLSFHWYDRWATLINWHFKLEWPSFNVADMAISVSVCWLILASFRKK